MLGLFATVNPEITAGVSATRTLFVTDTKTTIPTELTPKNFLDAAKWLRKEFYREKQTIDFLLQKNICSLHKILQPFAHFKLNEFYTQIKNRQTNIFMLSYSGKPVNSFLTIDYFLQAAELYEQVQAHIINNN